MKRYILITTFFCAQFSTLKDTLAYSLSFRWAPNAESNLAGYRLYYGNAARTYSQFINLQKVVTYKLDGLENGETYFFALTAYNTAGLESDFSSELNYFKPISLTIKKTGLILASVSTGKNYLLEGTANLKDWLGVETKTAASNVIEFSVPLDDQMKFFRLKKLNPVAAMAMMEVTMEPGLVASVTEANTLVTKKRFTRKVKDFFKYRRRFEPDYRKGAEVLMDISQKHIKNDISPGDLKSPPPPMPVRIVE